MQGYCQRLVFLVQLQQSYCPNMKKYVVSRKIHHERTCVCLRKPGNPPAATALQQRVAQNGSIDDVLFKQVNQMNVNNGCQVAQIRGTKSQGLAIPWHIVAKLIHSSSEFLPLKTGATSPVLTTWCFLRNDMFHLETKKNCGKSLQLLLKRKPACTPTS